MRTSRKILAAVAVVFLSSALIPSVATAAPKPSNKPVANNNEVKVTCKQSNAVGHRGVKMAIPKLQKFNKI